MKKVKPIVKNYNDEEIELISKKFNLTHISSRILLNRKLRTVEEINEFLYPNFNFFEDAKIYKDLEKGCKRIIEAINNKERILIYGDYDVDGVTSISQFVILLKKAGAVVSYYVPERENEGYGISRDFIEKITKDEIKMDLLITVDCGIAEVNTINEINNLSKEVIILDHHQCGDLLPAAYAVINPKQKDCPSKNKQLCAAGLSFKFLKHLNSFLNITDVENKLLELACLGTIADIVDLIGDNRIITYNGLKLINDTKIIGLKKLIEKAGIVDKIIESYHIGYILAPRINAAGRMSSAIKAIRLMLTEDENEAEYLAEELERLNLYRKQTESEIFNEAINKIEEDYLYKKNIIVVYGENWHEGVLGIVSSKITEKYEKPSIVISVKEGIGKGSARSLDYLNIYEALKSSEQYLSKYGGHKLAAGLTLNIENINQLYNELNKYIDKIALNELEYKELDVDSYIESKDITYRLYDEIYKFEPFGHGNHKPIFAIENVVVKDLRRVGKIGNHLSFKVEGYNNDIPVIGFGKIGLLEKILTKPSSLIVSITENEFRGNKKLQLVLINVEEKNKLDCDIDENKVKIINSVINKSKSKIIKTDIFRFVEKLNNLYNIKTTEEEVICILRKDESIEYVLKEDILYIKK
ncbi:single-stranded-DNA-specific exonuclease [Sedimentibacter acidaminivorans]|uniref:Single-stranded-DNA-specific exonuclease RecJ n=1 Tax=Sedimentibacter acidaminivorans TaxID=913099 RepID=A0ABS4GBG0_9FIRM|nr:single-stranded-DNA-specific exonuclease RecJ [Sedimentibacter acidaminivorans]MBP1925011.1 single-stranded-DNA-specific exonuclease [Sedimentibacter acidaminivorans]